MTLIESGGMCLKQLFDDIVDSISCSHASKMSLVPLTQDNKGNSVCLPTAPRPALMPVLTAKFWGQTKTAPLFAHSYTIVHQE